MEDEPFQQQVYSIMTKTNCSDNAFFGGRNVNIQYEVFSSVDGIVQACVYLVKTNCKGLLRFNEYLLQDMMMMMKT